MVSFTRIACMNVSQIQRHFRRLRQCEVGRQSGAWLKPVLGNLAPTRPDETQPWTICITNGPTQYLYTSDQEPGRVYKLTLDGKIVGVLGESGHELGQFNWIHGIACPSENTIYVADMNNWRVQKLILHPENAKPSTAASR